MPQLTRQRICSPVGDLLLVECDDTLVALAFAHRWSTCVKHVEQFGSLKEISEGACRASGALHLYFQGELGALETVRWRLGGTAFQESVWQALKTIPWGETLSYLELAKRIGRPRAVRAVANAVGANPLAIALPCHRVMGSDGSLTGFGGGLEKKRWLLKHEGVDV